MLNQIYRFSQYGSGYVKAKQLAKTFRYASFTVKDVLREISETGTLVTRFAKHIALERHKDCKRVLVPTQIRYVDYFPLSDVRHFQKELRKTKDDQLPALIIFTSIYRCNAEPLKYANILNELDGAAMKQLDNMGMSTVLETLYALLFIIPNWIMRTDFYQAAVKRLVLDDFKNGSSKQTFVELCFYLGLNKKQPTTTKLLNRFLEDFLHLYLSQLNEMDLTVVCNAAYKAAIIVESQAYEQRLIDAVVLNSSLEEPNDALLITFVKSLRLQRVRSEIVCRKLEEICKTSGKLAQLQPQGISHLYAYFAETLWDHDSSYSIIEEFMKRITAPVDQRTEFRAKDLATFLWSSAQLNCKFTLEQLQHLEAVLLEKVAQREFQFFPDNLVDSCLSLWILGYHSRELLVAAVEMKQSHERPNFKPRPKVDNRLIVLQSLVSIERPEWINDLNKMERSFTAFTTDKVPSYLLKERNDLSVFADKLKKNEIGISYNVEIVCPIIGINIPGLMLTTKDGSKIFVELLTAKQSLHFSQLPISLIRIKKRLLQALGHRVIVLRASDLLDDDSKLMDLLFCRDEKGIQ